MATKIDPAKAAQRVEQGAKQAADLKPNVVQIKPAKAAKADPKNVAKAEPKKSLLIRLPADQMARLDDYAWKNRTSMNDVIAKFVESLPEIPKSKK